MITIPLLLTLALGTKSQHTVTQVTYDASAMTYIESGARMVCIGHTFFEWSAAGVVMAADRCPSDEIFRSGFGG